MGYEWFVQEMNATNVVHWDKEECHEMKIDIGLTSIVMESEDTMPELTMSLKSKHI